MGNNVYIDGVRHLNVVNGMVRLECVVAEGGRPPEDGPAFEHAQTLVLSLPAFVQMFGNMEKLVNQLVERGVLTDRRGQVNHPQAADGTQVNDGDTGPDA